VAVLTADARTTRAGRQYVRESGTSMAAAMVSGAVACLRSAAPGLTPAAIAALLRDTAWRGTAGLPAGPPGADPRWQAARGYGAVDLYAAKLELEQRDRTQPTRLSLDGNETHIDVRLRTQRERGVATFDFERAPDVAGAPGTFAVIDAVGATGDSSLADATNRQVYARSWNVPGNERGVTFWYRVAWNEGGVRYSTPARRFTAPSGPSAATVEVTLVHNAYDQDVDGTIEIGGTVASPAVVLPLPGSSAAVSSDWVDGASENGNIAWTFHVEVPAGLANTWLPPSPASPWRLRLQEGGFVNRSGRLTTYRVIVHGGGGDVIYIGGPTPLFTLEGQTVMAAVPQSVTAVTPQPGAATALSVAPNPGISGGSVRFRAAAHSKDWLEIYDLEGRRVARVSLALVNGERVGQWSLRDAGGQPVRPGVYVARASGGLRSRVVVLSR
jgi:hypothetical protein